MLAGEQEVNPPLADAGPTDPGVWAAALDAAKVRFNDGWHEVKAGVVFWAEPRWDESGMAGGKARAQSYVAEAGPMEQAGAGLYGEATSEIHYFETNRHRMRYAEFRAEGYPIGSGTVESACKRVIGARLKQAGMRWTKAGAQAVLNLRTHLLSDRWDAIWPATRPQLISA